MKPLIPRNGKKEKEKTITLSRLREIALAEANDLHEQLLFSRLLMAVEKS